MADSSRSSNRRGGDDDTRAGGAMLLRETVMELAPGSVLADRFQIRRVLGKGATGVVLEADDRVSRSLVALKVFKPEIATDERWQEIVGSELRHARKIQHANVCRIYDAGDADGYRFLSMEFATGGTLRQRIKDAGAGRTDEERIADARAVVSGLAAIHEAGIIHRDVKPDNVLRMEDGRLVVTDFGLAIAPGQTTFMSGYSGAVGTPSYMAPEVALGGDATMASDVFSLGVILHELFYDRRPEWETTKRGRFLKPPVEKPRSRLQRSMVRLCSECLEELAPRRPQSAAEVKGRFERAVLGRYGSMLSALRAGRWGIAAGILLAAAATALTFVLARPRKPSLQAKIVGVAADWTRSARRIVSRNGPFLCSYPSRDGRRVKVIWGDPPEAVSIDVESGEVSPWVLAREMIQGGCPQWSPNGASVIFPAPKEQRIMWSDKPDGSHARPLAPGFRGMWLPTGRDVVHDFDGHRLAVTDLGGRTKIVSEAASAEESTHALDVSPLGDRVAALYSDFRQGRSAVVIYSVSSWAPLRRVEFTTLAHKVEFANEEDLIIALRDGAGATVARLRKDNVLVREGTLGIVGVADVTTTNIGRLVSATRISMSLVAQFGDRGPRTIADGPGFGRLSVSENGDVIAEQFLPDLRSVVARYKSKTGQLETITDGPLHRDPLFVPGGRQFAYIDAGEGRRIRVCSVASPGQCTTLLEDPGTAALLGFSPSGLSIAYATRTGINTRLIVRRTAGGGESVDLGQINARCRVRWAHEERLWLFERSPQFQGWREIDIRTRLPTGATRTSDPSAGDCPDEAADQEKAGLRLVRHEDAELWRVPSSE
jgi:hypothetical protein